MAEFPLKKPVVSPVPIVTVDEGIEDGVHIFELRVEDNLGQVSDPVRLRVTSRELPGPRDPIKPRDPRDPIDEPKPVKPKPKPPRPKPVNPKPVKPKPAG